MSPPATPGLLHWLIPPPPSPDTGTPAGIPHLPSPPLHVNGDPSPGFTECHAVACKAQRIRGVCELGPPLCSVDLPPRHRPPPPTSVVCTSFSFPTVYRYF
ncbi:unnamed protein product [Rangifer tarandus platyrhynchus]|uniref:Uncharacterized protein n=2 Tax=Rangifer tarandus platyrhynchus TaxID=3082113 RepID=A0AC59YAL8_RANTA|nr:unnamed protein product [Rangifer tarandus platyrhynchus]